jgi:hypothetical protein
VGTSSSTDEKRETLRELVRGQMRAGEMANEPETLERKRRPAQQGPAEPWQSTIGKKTKNVRTKGKAMQDVLDDFFEGDDSDANEGTEGGGWSRGAGQRAVCAGGDAHEATTVQVHCSAPQGLRNG